MFKDLVQSNRSYRRFDHSVPVSMQTLEELVELARLCPSAANKQPLRFILSTAPSDNDAIFTCLKWAAYLTDWDGPAPSEQPSAYIVMVNTSKDWEFAKFDLGIMAQTMLLGAVEKGLGGCIIGALDREKLRAHFSLQPEMDVSLVLALGKPAEDVRIVDVTENGSIKYYRDDAGVHYVPKRSLVELTLDKRC
ncbi:nitroreductase family protein [Desulfopila aestuarii]|uniref:Nitroreductase n=1 Tax=Desulfopila aestuarii DSM 18488 TaxID=1121416 RepID=A0A1M7XYP1_9BACT|nr:nitroreductase family protein [Desulfopila aestuarii]SHO44189.1 Nitroreductase [Desulfopila aestuarii DSM 18488]